MDKPRKKPPPYFYTGPTKPEADETEDIYNNEERETMLEEDEMTAAEEGFMKGREQEPPAKKETRKKAISHADSISVELAKEDTEED